MNRRDLIKAFVGGIASVAIGMRVSRGMPEVLADGYEYTTYGVARTIGRESFPATADGQAVFDAISSRYADALARSMMQTKEAVAANVLNRVFSL